MNFCNSVEFLYYPYLLYCIRAQSRVFSVNLPKKTQRQVPEAIKAPATDPRRGPAKGLTPTTTIAAQSNIAHRTPSTIKTILVGSPLWIRRKNCRPPRRRERSTSLSRTKPSTVASEAFSSRRGEYPLESRYLFVDKATTPFPAFGR